MSKNITIDVDDSQNGKDSESVLISIDSGVSIQNYQNDNGNVDGSGLRQAISDFTSTDNPISAELLRKVIRAFASS